MSHSMEIPVQREIRAMAGNTLCADCGTPNPQWASVSFGSCFCLECSGQHRGLGVHVSFVRSITMDSWSEKQIRMMREGGNAKLLSWFAEHGVSNKTSISEKYNSPEAELYRERLLAAVEGRPLPTEMPKRAPPRAASSSGSGGHGSGDRRGMERLAGESDEQYIARQRGLKEEASARMRDKFGSGRMQGLGSDPGYDPSRGGYGDAGSQLGDISQKSMRLLTDSVGALSAGVSRTTQVLQDEQLGQKISSGFQSVAQRIADPNLSQNLRGGAEKTWGWVAGSATSLWSKAQQVAVGGDEPLSLYNRSAAGGGGGSVGVGGGGGKYQGFGSSSVDGSTGEGSDARATSGGGGGGGTGAGSYGGNAYDNSGGSGGDWGDDWGAAPSDTGASVGSSRVDDLLTGPTSSPPRRSEDLLQLRPASVSPPRTVPLAAAAAPAAAPQSMGPPPGRKAMPASPPEDEDFFGSFGLK